MKRLYLVLALMLVLCACGEQEKVEKEEPAAPETEAVVVPEVSPEETVPQPETGDAELETRIPLSIRGTYVYEDEVMSARMIIDENGYALTAEAEGAEGFEASGDVAYMGNYIYMTDDGNSLSCPYDSVNGIINFDGYEFKKQ